METMQIIEFVAYAAVAILTVGVGTFIKPFS